jgi:ArsR family transcriptional regulator
MELNNAAACLEALGNPTRLKIYRALVRAGPDGLSVGALNKRVGGALSTLSHHLHRLIVAGLVSQERHATTLTCSANYPKMTGLMDFLTQECCSQAQAPGEDGP